MAQMEAKFEFGKQAKTFRALCEDCPEWDTPSQRTYHDAAGLVVAHLKEHIANKKHKRGVVQSCERVVIDVRTVG